MTADDRPYHHPGQAFIARHGILQTEADVLQYVDFLRQQSGLSDTPPIALSRIYQHFGMPTPLRAPLEEQQGILVDSSSGIILIKEDDPIARQRFTEGHELMELLFDAQSEARSHSHLPDWDETRKERWCDRGAAELLMPPSSFVPQLNQLGMSLKTARTLAERYQTSLLATALRMIQHSQGDHALVMWHLDLKPSERKRLVEQKDGGSEEMGRGIHEGSRPENRRQPPPKLKTQSPSPPSRPIKKLRIWWRAQTSGWSGGYIPKDKSAPHNSLIRHAYVTGQPQQGSERLDLGWRSLPCKIDALPLQVGEKSCVLSLLQHE